MRTKVIELKTGGSAILYLNESTGLWSRSRCDALDVFHERIMNGTDKKAKIIRQYYSACSITHTRNKIREMVNDSEEKLDLLYDTIITIRGQDVKFNFRSS